MSLKKLKEKVKYLNGNFKDGRLPINQLAYLRRIEKKQIENLGGELQKLSSCIAFFLRAFTLGKFGD